MIVEVREVRSRRLIGRVRVEGDVATAETGRSALLALAVVQGVLRRAAGDTAALDGWTNGYVQVRAA
jgi:hypothetical protein